MNGLLPAGAAGKKAKLERRVAALSTEETLAGTLAAQRDESELPGPAGDQWQAFVVAAAQYQRHLQLDGYLSEDHRCLYCRQDLAPAAVALMARYKIFLDDTLARQVPIVS